MQFLNLPLCDIKEYEKNTRTHSDEQIEEVMQSIKTYGFINPIIITKDNVVVAGHCRIEAMRRLEETTIPAIRYDHLENALQIGYSIADNKLALKTGWDLELLRDEFVTLQEQGFDPTLTGFSDDEIFEIINPEPLYSVDDEEEGGLDIPQEPITKKGDVWVLGNHRLV